MSGGRLSASIVLLKRRPLRADFQVLMVQRGNISLAGMFAFPGGMAESHDECLRDTALRELFEETGVLPSSPRKGSTLTSNIVQKAREVIHNDASSFSSFLKEHGIAKEKKTLHHFTTFIAPNFAKLKFITPFFVKAIEEEDVSDRYMEADHKETAQLEWVTPADALERNSAGKMVYLPPQAYVLNVLNHNKTIDAVMNTMELQQSRVHNVTGDNIMTTKDARGLPPMKPYRYYILDEQSSGGEKGKPWTLCLPGDEHHDQHPGKRNSRHRMYCQQPMGKGYTLERSSQLAVIQ